MHPGELMTEQEIKRLRLTRVLSEEGLLTLKRFAGMTYNERQAMLDRVILACSG